MMKRTCQNRADCLSTWRLRVKPQSVPLSTLTITRVDNQPSKRPCGTSGHRTATVTIESATVEASETGKPRNTNCSRSCVTAAVIDGCVLIGAFLGSRRIVPCKARTYHAQRQAATCPGSVYP